MKKPATAAKKKTAAASEHKAPAPATEGNTGWLIDHVRSLRTVLYW
jgi:hypothetical protein